jgi:hypothetical protein
VRFLKQYKEYQLKPIVLGNPTAVDEGILKLMATRRWACTRQLVFGRHHLARQPALREGDPDRIQGDAGLLHRRHLHRGLWLEAALKSINGKFEDKPAFVRALHSAK